MSADAKSCPISTATRRMPNTGMLWLVGSFLLCPCHLPITLGILATALSGTAIGALVTGHTYLAGTVVTLAWAAGTWRGIRHLRSARMDVER